jgi:HK97 family phage major capsid protein
MKKSDQLKLERAGKVKAQGDLLAKAKAENRELTEAENATFDTLDGEIAALDTNIERALKVEAAELRAAGLEGAKPLNGDNPEKPKAKRAFSLNKAIRALIDGSELDGPELEANTAGKDAARAAGVGVSPGSFVVPMFSTRADGQTVTEDSGAFGGNTVATDLQGPIDFLRPQPVVESLGAVFLTGLQGNLQFPKNNGGVTATWEGEVDEVTNTKTAWGKIEMAPKRLAVSVLISLQNLMQSSFDMEMYTMGEIRKAIENEIDKAALVGSGTGEPTGLLNAAGTNSVAIGTNGGALTFAKAIDMETEVFVDNANAARMNYVSNSKVRGKAKQTVLESGQATYLLQNNEINGYPFANSNHIPSNLTKGTSSGVCSAMIFGDFSKLVVGQWGFMDLSVDDKSRKKEGYIEVTANVYLDVAVLEPKAFTVCKDITT